MTDETAGKQKMGCGKIALWGVGILVGLMILGAIVGDPPSDEVANEDGIDTLAGAEAFSETENEPSEPENEWTQFEQNDELRGTSNRFAEVTSTNSVDFEFPYSGGSRLTVTVRKTAQYGEDVIFQIDDGQFICGIYDCAGMISIDGNAEQLSLKPPADHDSKTLFAKYPAAIIRKLKNSEDVIVELPFYQEGNRQFKFETAGLEWE